LLKLQTHLDSSSQRLQRAEQENGRDLQSKPALLEGEQKSGGRQAEREREWGGGCRRRERLYLCERNKREKKASQRRGREERREYACVVVYTSTKRHAQTHTHR